MGCILSTLSIPSILSIASIKKDRGGNNPPLSFRLKELLTVGDYRDG